MAEKKEKDYLEGWGLKSRRGLVKLIQASTEDLESTALRIFALFRAKTTEWQQEYLEGRRKRFVAETIEPPEGKLIKSPDRIAEKILDSWMEYDQWEMQPRGTRGEAPERHDPKDFLCTMTDVVRFRIVCNYLSDVEYIDKKIKGFARKSNGLKVTSRQDHIETPFSQRRAGHRAIQYTMQYLDAESPALFEVQVMTQLQHAWDKKDHHLIYEYVRIKEDGKIPVHLKNRMAAMSEMLYVADDAFDSLREQISAIMEKKKNEKKK